MVFKCFIRLVESLINYFNVKSMPGKVLKEKLGCVINTLIAIAALSPEDSMFKGYPLSEYKLDPAFRQFIYPRGVRLIPSRLAQNYKVLPKPLFYVKSLDGQPDEEVVYETLTPEQFSAYQGEIMRILRKSENLSVDVAEESRLMMLSDAFSKASFETEDGQYCHYNSDDPAYLPKEISFKDESKNYAIFNYPVEEMIEELVSNICKEIANR